MAATRSSFASSLTPLARLRSSKVVAWPVSDQGGSLLICKRPPDERANGPKKSCSSLLGLLPIGRRSIPSPTSHLKIKRYIPSSGACIYCLTAPHLIRTDLTLTVPHISHIYMVRCKQIDAKAPSLYLRGHPLMKTRIEESSPSISTKNAYPSEVANPSVNSKQKLLLEPR